MKRFNAVNAIGAIAFVLIIELLFNTGLYALDSSFTLRHSYIDADRYSWIRDRLGEEDLLAVITLDRQAVGEATYEYGSYTSEKGEGTYILSYISHPLRDYLIRRDHLLLNNSPDANMSIPTEGFYAKYEGSGTDGSQLEVRQGLVTNFIITIIIGIVAGVAVAIYGLVSYIIRTKYAWGQKR